jgi:hypothetical protein
LDLDSEDEICDELFSLRKENEELVDLLDNRDHMLREAKKLRKELRSLLEDARTIMADLEAQVLDSKLEIDSLKASSVVSDEVDCADCSVFLADLTDLRVELAELQSRPTLLGACTSCSGLHEKIAELRSCIVSLEADLKVHIPTSCSTCELHAVKNLDLAKCVGHLQDEDDKLREVLSWLPSQEPQLGMMIASYKRFDGWALGFDKVGESSGEREGKFGNVPVPPQSTPKDKFAPKPNQLLKPREKQSEKPSEKPCEEPHPKPKPRSICFHCEFCGKDGHKKDFCYKRRREARMAKEWANKDRYHPSHGVPEPRMSLPKGKSFVYTVPAWRDRRASGGDKAAGRGPPARPVRVTGQTGARQIAREFGFPGRDARGFSPFSHGTDGKHLEFGGVEFARHSPPRDQYEFGRGRIFESQRGYDHCLSFVVLVLLQ